ncbi:oxidoreductase [Sesbania bispinosa]|nr:oxidoreductase [Sesbania bispinosa]
MTSHVSGKIEHITYNWLALHPANIKTNMPISLEGTQVRLCTAYDTKHTSSSSLQKTYIGKSNLFSDTMKHPIHG